MSPVPPNRSSSTAQPHGQYGPHWACRELRILRRERQLGDDLPVEAHLHHPRRPGLALNTFAKQWNPIGITFVGAAAEHESGIADPEILSNVVADEGDAVAFREARVDRAQQAAIGVERNELASVKTDDLSSNGRDDGVVHPTARGARDTGQICPVSDHLVGGNVGGLAGIYGHHTFLISRLIGLDLRGRHLVTVGAGGVY